MTLPKPQPARVRRHHSRVHPQRERERRQRVRHRRRNRRVIGFDGARQRQRIHTARSARRPTTRPPTASRTSQTRLGCACGTGSGCAVNLVNGSTLAGLAVAGAGGARWPAPRRAARRHRLPAARTASARVHAGKRDHHPPGGFGVRHPAVQARGPALHPVRSVRRSAYAAAVLRCGGRVLAHFRRLGPWNVFERAAGLADGNYTDRPLRARLRRSLEVRARQHALHVATIPAGNKPDMPD